MPRKDKKSKKPKKPKVQPKVQTLRPPKLKPCTDCGYKTGSAFTIPFGFADRLGTRRLETPVAPVVNINLGDYFKSDTLKKPIAKKEISIQTEDPLDYVKLPLTSIKAPSDFEMEQIYKKSNIPSAVAITSPFGEPFQYPSPFIEVEGEYEPVSKRVAKIESMKIKGTGPTLKKPAQPEAVYEGNKETNAPRYRRSNVEIYAELLIQNGETPNNAMGIAKSYPKEQLKEKIAELKEALGKQKKV